MLTSTFGRALVVSAMAMTAAPSFRRLRRHGNLPSQRPHQRRRPCCDRQARGDEGAERRAQAFRRRNDCTPRRSRRARWRAHEEGATSAQVAQLPTEVQTGRSIAVDSKSYATLPGIGVLMAGASATIDRLSSLDGTTFDNSYKATRHGALKTLEGPYDSYSHTGDNAA